MQLAKNEKIWIYTIFVAPLGSFHGSLQRELFWLLRSYAFSQVAS